jgi:hypothetical protein
MMAIMTAPSQASLAPTGVPLNPVGARLAREGAFAACTPPSRKLERLWRNARTLSSHNPRVDKDRIVGDFAVNGTLPPKQWRIGVSD